MGCEGRKADEVIGAMFVLTIRDVLRFVFVVVLLVMSLIAIFACARLLIAGPVASADEFPSPRFESFPSPKFAAVTSRPAPAWTRVPDDDVPVDVPCASCPSGSRKGTFAEIKSRHRPGYFMRHQNGGWCFAETDERGEVKGWLLYMDGDATKYEANPGYVSPEEAAIDKRFWEKHHWELSMGSCGMICSAHGGGWVLRANKEPVTTPAAAQQQAQQPRGTLRQGGG